MDITGRIEADIKTAMLSGDKVLAETLRLIKSSILYQEVATGKRGEGLSEDELVLLLQKEAKKRRESAELFRKGGNDSKAKQEEAELVVIEGYLPEQMGDDELDKIVEDTISSMGADASMLGQVIGSVKQRFGSSVDGGRVAQIVKAKLI
jgi:uncharacterized protein